MSEYEVFYPGVYSEEDQSALDEHLARCHALDERGDVDLQALVNCELEGVSGIDYGPRGKRELVDWQCALETSNYEPHNPIYNDDEYAKGLGYKGKPCVPLTANTGMFCDAMPWQLRDNLVISGLNHTLYFNAPVYPGDTLYSVSDHQHVVDMTPEKGSELRTFALFGNGRVVNQHGEVVLTGYSRVKESLRRHADPAKRNPTPIPIWECPDWWDLRPRHYYTPEDWDKIKEIWAQEPQRGSEYLYWDDVEIGTYAPDFLEGPVGHMDQIKFHGFGEIGSPSLKHVMKDPMLSKALLVDDHGEYYELNGVGHLEDGHVPGHRPAFYNHMPVHFALQALKNWIGDHGDFWSVSWRIMNILPGYEDDIPDFEDPDSYIGQVPGMGGKTITTHGMTSDVMWFKFYIKDKYEKDGKYYVDLIWWIQTIDEIIYQEGKATIILPKK